MLYPHHSFIVFVLFFSSPEPLCLQRFVLSHHTIAKPIDILVSYAHFNFIVLFLLFFLTVCEKLCSRTETSFVSNCPARSTLTYNLCLYRMVDRFSPSKYCPIALLTFKAFEIVIKRKVFKHLPTSSLRSPVRIPQKKFYCDLAVLAEPQGASVKDFRLA